MQEWWTYGLSDFLLFSPRTYYRLIERYNGAVWPGHLLTVGAAGLVLGLLRDSGVGRQRAVSGALAFLWAWVAWSFLWRRYATINWAAAYFAGGFAAQALLLAWLGVVRGGVSFRLGAGPARRVGVALFVLAVAGYPLLAPLLGRGWAAAEVFGIVPDPTAVATLGLALQTDRGSRRWLLTIPFVWCLVSGATLWAMGAPEAWLLLLSGALAGSLALLPDRSRNPSG